MKSAWQGSLTDWAAINSNEAEEVDLVEYSKLLDADEKALAWDREDERGPQISTNYDSSTTDPDSST